MYAETTSLILRKTRGFQPFSFRLKGKGVKLDGKRDSRTYKTQHIECFGLRELYKYGVFKMAEEAVKTMDDFNYDDIVPMPLDDSKEQLGQIIYTEDYRSTTGILRGLLAKKEYSERALAVTDAVIKLNPAHYTVWQYKYDIIKHFTEQLKTEQEKIQYVEKQLEINEAEAINNPKNYQIWNYRQLLVQLNPKPNAKKEFPLIEAIIIEDNKNYHTWSYRMWLVTHFNLYESESEIDFVNILLSKDLRNNSAWNFRFFLKFNEKSEITTNTVEKEIAYVKNMISNSPQNPSSWGYLTGIYNHTKRDLAELEDFCLQYAEIGDVSVEQLKQQDNSDQTADAKPELAIKSVYALKVLQTVYEKTQKDKSLKALDVLLHVDPIRVNYYNYKKSLLMS